MISDLIRDSSKSVIFVLSDKKDFFLRPFETPIKLFQKRGAIGFSLVIRMSKLWYQACISSAER